MALVIATSAFKDGGIIPARYSCFGDNVQPELEFSNPPDGTSSYAVIFHDIDVALDKLTEDGLHWAAWNIPVESAGVPEGGLPEGAVLGRNVEGRNAYLGPGAPWGPRYHHYVLEVFALDSALDIPETSGRSQLMAAMDGKIVGKAAYVGRFRRGKRAASRRKDLEEPEQPSTEGGDGPAAAAQTDHAQAESSAMTGSGTLPSGYDEYWTPERQHEARQRLLERSRELRADIQREMRKYDDDRYSLLADRVRDTGDESVADLLTDLDHADVHRDVSELREVETALMRIATGTYGTCVDCGEPIEPARLEVQPQASRDIACQERFERRERPDPTPTI
jgi:Raf kinase inhibitor-like YbhB/YbcL family protein